jgi:Effector protein
VTLGHELIHGLHALNGDSKSGSTIKIDGKDTSEEEAFTVGLGRYDNATYSENKLREDFGLPPRLSYP